MSSTVFKVESGVLALTLVDPAAVGYLTSWQAPAGKEIDAVLLTDYASGSTLSCQVTSGALNATPNTTDDVTAATFCSPEETTTSVGVTSYTLDVAILQDPQIADGVSAWLFENDTKEAFFYLGLAGDGVPPASIGRVRVVAGAFGGDARVTLVATMTLPVVAKPDIWYGDATTNRVVKGDGSAYTPAATATTSSSRKRETVDA